MTFASPALRCMLIAALLGATGSARAQWAWGVSLLSDDRFRGVSLSAGQPDLRMSLAYENLAGWFGGAALSTAEFDAGRRDAALFSYAGYAQRASATLSWELGGSIAHFAADPSYDYLEVFAGVAAEQWNLRVFGSPSYFGGGVRTLYVEANGHVPLAGAWRLFGHAGQLSGLGGDPRAGTPRSRLDASVGVGADLRGWSWQLAWVCAPQSTLYPVADNEHRNSVTISASHYF